MDGYNKENSCRFIKKMFYTSAIAKLDRTGYNSDSLKTFCADVLAAGIAMKVLE